MPRKKNRRGQETEQFLSDLHAVYKKQRKAVLRKTGPEVYYRYDKVLKKNIIGSKRGPVDFDGVITIDGAGRAVC
jgi:hypothetical protein